MATKIEGTLQIYILFSLIDLVTSTTCYYYIRSVNFYGSIYCYYQCCNYNTYSPCCSYSSYDYNSYYYNYWATYYTLSAGAIAGIVIGCIIALSVFISIIICVCNANRRNINRGQVITGTQPTVAYVSSTNNTNLQTYPYNGNVNGGFTMGPAAPAPYTTYFAPPPSYSNVINEPNYKPALNEQPTLTTPNQQAPYQTQPDTTTPNQQAHYPTQPDTTQNTTNYTSLTHNSGDHYYSSVSDSHSPSAPDSNATT